MTSQFGLQGSNRVQSHFQTLTAKYWHCHGGEQHHLQLRLNPIASTILYPKTSEIKAFSGIIQDWFSAAVHPDGYLVSQAAKCGEGECSGQKDVLEVCVSLPVILIFELDTDTEHSKKWSFPPILSVKSTGQGPAHHPGLTFSLTGRIFHSPGMSHYRAHFTVLPRATNSVTEVWDYDGMENNGWCTELIDGSVQHHLSGSDFDLARVPAGF